MSIYDNVKFEKVLDERIEMAFYDVVGRWPDEFELELIACTIPLDEFAAEYRLTDGDVTVNIGPGLKELGILGA